MTAKSSGFSLIELLVVVAIIGILSSIATLSYQGYVSGTKKKSTENVMQQIALLQTEYLSNNGDYFFSTGATGATGDDDPLDACNPTTTGASGTEGTSEELERKMFDEGDIITKEMGYWICVAPYKTSSYIMVALEAHNINNPPDDLCRMSMTANSNKNRNKYC